MWNYITQALTALVSFAMMVMLITAAVKRGVSVPFSLFILSLVLSFSFGAWSSGEWNMWPTWKSAVPLLLVAGLCSVLGNWAMFLATSSSANVRPVDYRLPVSSCPFPFLLVSRWRTSLVKITGNCNMHRWRSHHQLAPTFRNRQDSQTGAKSRPVRLVYQ